MRATRCLRRRGWSPRRGLSVHGPSIATQSQVSITGGGVRHRMGICATWTISARRPGRYRIGPPSVQHEGKRVSGQRGGGGGGPRWRGRTSTAAPSSRSIPSASPAFHRSPGFNAPDDDTGNGDDSDRFDLLPPYPNELRVDRAPDPMAFLRAVVHPTHAVVGQQVTLSNLRLRPARGVSRNEHLGTQP